MKKFILPLFILNSYLAFAESQDGTQPDKEEVSAYYMKQISEQNPTLQRAMEIEGVRPIYKQCFDLQYKAGNGTVSGSALMGCLWDGTADGSIQGVSQNAELQKKVLESVEKTADGKEVNSIRYQQNVKTQKKANPGMQALQEYYKKKLDEALYGDKNPENYKDKLIKSERTVDQRIFFELHQSQLGKNLVAAVSSYCIDAHLSGELPFIHSDESKRKAHRLNNMQSLQDVQGDKIGASKNWSICLANIQHMCHRPSEIAELDKDGNKTNNVVRKFSKASQQNSCEASSSLAGTNPNKKEANCDKVLETTQIRACEVTQYITESRQNLIAIEKTLENYDKLAVTTRNPANVKIYSGSESGHTVDDVTSITSKEVLDSGYAQANKDLSEEMKKCTEQNDEEACKQYLNQNKEEAYGILAEVKLKQEAVAQKLRDIDEKDTEKIKELLLEEGYSEEDALKMASIDGIKDQINERYEAKKNAIINRMSDEIKKTTVSGQDFDMAADQGKVVELKNEIESKSREFAELVHFNNIVSGYLNITDEQGQETKNTASIARELESNIFQKDNLEQAKDLNITNNSGIDYDDYANKIASTGVELDPSGGSDDSGSKDLSTEQINDNLLNYFGKKKDPNAPNP